VSAAFFWLFLMLMALGMPVAFALLAGPAASLLLDGQSQYFTALLARFYNGLDSFPLLAVPLFILAGELMNSGGITRSIVAFSLTMVGHVRGGLAQVAILSSMLFAGISGSAVAGASAIGKNLIPAMEQAGYRRDFAAGVLAAASILGPIIPPSGIMVLYGFVMNVSIGALFAAGIVPGILMGLGLMAATRLLAKRNALPVANEKASWGERGRAFKGAGWALLMPVILLGGVLSGLFTATEAAAVAAIYALIIATFVLKTLDRAGLQRVFVQTAVQSGVILTLVGAAVTLGWLVSVSGVAEDAGAALRGLSEDPYTLLLLVNLLLFVVGMFLDAGPAILILGPVIAPIFTDMGVHPVHFAMIMCVNLTIGLATPPMGLVLFVTSSVSGERVGAIVRTILPFLAVEIAVLFLFTYVPELVLWLPRTLGLIQ
jgi:tripartite ATP-independent transporter DctM subunit